MGNRAVIEHIGTDGKADGGIYLHWNGGRDSVEAFLEYAKLQGVNSVSNDYQIARLAQIIGNFIDGNYSLGILNKDDLSSPGDNGIYVVDTELNIIDRKDFKGHEQEVYDRSEFLKGIDAHQPKHMQLGEDFIDAYLESKSNPIPLKDIEIGDKVATRDHNGGWNTYTILGFGDKGQIGNGYDLEGLPFFNMTERYPEGYIISKWSDEEALRDHKNNSNCYLKPDDEFVLISKNASLEVSEEPNIKKALKIVERAEEIGVTSKDNRMNNLMDMEHALEAFDIDIEKMIKADKKNFTHDFYGIVGNISRKENPVEKYTEKDFNYFVPRFCKSEDAMSKPEHDSIANNKQVAKSNSREVAKKL